MSSEPTPDSPVPERFSAVLSAYLAAAKAGGMPDRAALLARYPHLAAELEAFFAALDRCPPQPVPPESDLDVPGPTLDYPSSAFRKEAETPARRDKAGDRGPGPALPARVPERSPVVKSVPFRVAAEPPTPRRPSPLPPKTKPVGAVARMVAWAHRRPALVALLGLLLAVTAGGTAGLLILSHQVTQARDDADTWRVAAQEAVEEIGMMAAWESEAARVAWAQAEEATARADEESRSRKEEEEARKQLDGTLADLRAKHAALDRTNAELQAKTTTLNQSLTQAEQTLTANRLSQVFRHWQDDDLPAALELLNACPAATRGWDWRYARKLCVGGAFTLATNFPPMEAALVADGQLILARGPQAATVWDSHKGELLLNAGLTKPNERMDLSLSPDGRHYALFGTPDTIVIKGTRTRQQLAVLTGHKGSVVAAEFSPDGQRLVSLGQDGMVHVWDVAGGKEQFARPGVRAAWSPDGKEVAVVGPDQVLRLLGTDGKERLAWADRTGLLRAASAFGLATGPGQGLSLTALTLAVRRLPLRAAQFVLFSPDGRCLVWEDGGGGMTAADVRTGRELWRLPRPANGPLPVFSPDGRWLAVDTLRQVKVCETQTGREVVSSTCRTAFPREGPGGAARVAFSPDSRYAALADDTHTPAGNPKELAPRSGAGTFRLWDLHTGREALPARGGEWLGTNINFGPEGQLLTGRNNATAAVRSLDPFGLPTRSPNEIRCLVFSPDGLRLACGAQFGDVHVWDLHSGRQVGLLRGHTRAVLRLAFSPDGQRLLSAGGEHRLKVWDARNLGDALVLSGYGSGKAGVALHPKKPLFAAGRGRDVVIGDARSGQEMLVLRGHPGHVGSVAFSPDGQLLASGEREGGLVKLWDANTGQERHTLRLPPRALAGPITEVCLAFSHDGERLATNSPANLVVLWDVRTGREVQRLQQRHTQPILCVAFSPEGKHLVSCGMGPGPTAVLWDARTAQFLQQLTAVAQGGGVGGMVFGAAFSPDGKHLALAFGTGLIHVRDMPGARWLPALRGLTGPAEALAYSPDGRSLVAAGADTNVKVWDAGSGVQTLTLAGHAQRVRGLAFAPDGERLASLDLAGRLDLRDTHLFEEEVQLADPVHRGLNAVALNADATRVSARCSCGHLTTWNLDTRLALPVPDPFPADAGIQAQSPDGLRQAFLSNGWVIVRNRPTPAEMEHRVARLRADPGWHEGQALAAENAGQWSAAVFHREHVCRARPDDLAARRHLAEDQLGAGQEEAYRKTCGQLVARLAPEARLTGVALAADAGTGLLPVLAVRAVLADQAEQRRLVLQTCVLAADALSDKGRLLALAATADPVDRGAALCRAGRHDEAARLLGGPGDWRRLLYQALAEAGRGRRGEARQALTEALRQLDEPAPFPLRRRLPPGARLESERLRGEIEAVLSKIGAEHRGVAIRERKSYNDIGPTGRLQDVHAIDKEGRMHFLETIDLAGLFWFQSQHRQRPWLDTFMEGVTHVGDRLTILGVVLAAFAVCVLLQHVRTGLLLVGCACLAAGVGEGVKSVVKRPRPDVGFALVKRPDSASFPSGHALLSIAVFGSISVALARRLPRRSERILLLAGVGILVLLVGVSRLYLGVHYVTDVLGGWLAGGACALLFLWLDRRWGEIPASEGAQLATTAATPGLAEPREAGMSEQIVAQKEQFRP